MGIRIPTDHTRITPFKAPASGHTVRETRAVPPWLAMNIHRIAVAGEGAIKMMAVLLLIILGAYLRGRHLSQ